MEKDEVQTATVKFGEEDRLSEVDAVDGVAVTPSRLAAYMWCVLAYV